MTAYHQGLEYNQTLRRYLINTCRNKCLYKKSPDTKFLFPTPYSEEITLLPHPYLRNWMTMNRDPRVASTAEGGVRYWPDKEELNGSLCTVWAAAPCLYLALRSAVALNTTPAFTPNSNLQAAVTQILGRNWMAPAVRMVQCPITRQRLPPVKQLSTWDIELPISFYCSRRYQALEESFQQKQKIRP